MRLSSRLLLLILVCLVPMVGAQIYTQFDLQNRRQAQIGDIAMRQAERTNGDLASIIEGSRQLTYATSQLPAVRALDPDCAAQLGDLHRNLPSYKFLAVLASDGQLVCASAPLGAGFGTGQAAPWLAELLSAETFGIGRYATLPGVDGAFLPVVQPILAVGASGSAPGSGVVVAALDLRWLETHLMDRELRHPAASANGVLMVADRGGTLLARFPQPGEWRGRQLQPEALDLVKGPAPETARLTYPDGRELITAYVPISAPARGLATIVALYEPDLTADVDDASRLDLLVTVGSALLALVLTFFVGRHFIFDPTERLLAAARRWRDGDLRARADVGEQRSEFGWLAASFNAMAASLAMRDAERRSYAELLEARVSERTRALSDSKNRLQVEIAEREKTETALRHVQKLQAVGQLAGGVAHDFNNMLATILGCLDLMERRLEQGREAGDARLHTLIERATDAVQRGAQLTSRLLAFSRHQRLDVRVTDLNRLVSDLVTLASSTLGRRVRVRSDLAAELWPAIADSSQVEAAVLNLCLNARDAMPEGGVLTIATANETIFVRAAPDEPEPGAYVRITVTDTGAGMSPEVLGRVFEPFFTTKGPGGSGLGLSQVYGLARQSGGTVWIRSEPGQGTEVSLLLPRASEAEVAGTVPRPMEAAVRSDMADLVLLVDDDAAVRQVTADMLKELGCQVLEAPGGDEALALLAGHAARRGAAPDVLMLDYAMPGMNGLELARALRARGIMAPILLATGFAELADPPEAGTELLAGVLRKPFSIRDLRATLHGLRPRPAEEAESANVVPLRGAARI